MNIRSTLIFFSFLSLCLSTACSTTINRRIEQVSVAQFDSLRTTYYHLGDSLNWAFQTMMQDDSDKIDHMKRLLDEIHKSGYYEADTLNALYQSVEKLQAMQYDSISLAQSEIVSRYDSVAYATSEAVIQFTEKHPDFDDNPVMTVLVDQIIDATNSILLYRLQYDRLSQEFNHFLEEHRSIIATIDSTEIPVQKWPMFRSVDEYQEEENK